MRGIAQVRASLVREAVVRSSRCLAVAALGTGTVVALAGGPPPVTQAHGADAVAALAAAPDLVDPPEGAVLDVAGGLAPTTMWFFSWSRVDGADAYEVEITGPGAAGVYLDAILEDHGEGTVCFRLFPRCHVDVLVRESLPIGDGGSWSWRVRARQGGAWGAWSASRSFALRDPFDTVGADLLVVARVGGWPGGRGLLMAHWDLRQPPLAEGTIAADGTVEIVLPGMNLPESFRSGARVPTLLATEAVRNVVVTRWIVRARSGALLGTMTVGTSPSAEEVMSRPLHTRRGDAVAVWWYADADTTVRGSYLGDGVEYSFVLDLQVGWNLTLLRVVVGPEESLPMVVDVLTVDRLPDDVAWYWRAAPAAAGR